MLEQIVCLLQYYLVMNGLQVSVTFVPLQDER